MRREYPNVHATVRLIRTAPGVPGRESVVEIWLKGTRFRVRDEAGRDASTILEDLAHPRALGKPARTIEELMDATAERRASGVTELYGDVATNEGWVVRHNAPPWPIDAEALAPAAEQILAGETTPSSEVIEGDESGIAFRTMVTRAISGRFVIRYEARNAKNGDHFYAREVVALEEGVVTDSDVAAPP